MALSLKTFKQALLSQQPFSTMHQARVAERDGDIVINRTYHFAEARIEWQGGECIIMIPIGEESSRELLNRVAHLKQSPLQHLVEYSLLKKELIYTNHFGEEQEADLIMYRLPEATPLSEVIARGEVDFQKLYDSTFPLEELFEEARVCHNNLKESNLMVNNKGELLPIRFDYATLSRTAEEVNKEFNSLREWITSQSTKPIIPSTKRASTKRIGRKFDSIEGEFEGLRKVAVDGKYGYIDSNGHQAIPAIYSQAENFHEGRAAVTLEERMGLIDCYGKTIIEPLYDIVDYNTRSGYARVKSGDKWAIFSHNGEQVTPFESKYINEESISLFAQTDNNK